jgi:Arc/MetJ-type ribon-helix-helix transcriptional regulator
MGVVQVNLPEEIRTIIEREVSAGRVESLDAYLIEAARRFANDLALEDDIRAEAEAGIADAEAGKYLTIASPEDETALQERMLARLRERLAADEG